MTTFVVAGLEAEARIARRLGLPAIVAGGTPERREAVIDLAIEGGATGLLSFGIAGGLDPKLKPGTVLLPDRVHTEAGEAFATDPAWRARMLSHIPEALSGTLYGAETVVASVAEKRALFDRTEAIAVDLESAAVARAAAKAGLPFLVLRSIADPAHRSLPEAAVRGLNGAGKVNYGTVFGLLARRPHQFPALLFIAFDARRALASMQNVVALGAGFHARPAVGPISA